MKTIISLVGFSLLILGNGCAAAQPVVVPVSNTPVIPPVQSQTSSLPARTTAPLPGDFKKVILENRSDQIHWRASFLGHNILLPPGTRIVVKIAQPFGGLSPIVGQFYFVGYAYQIDEKGEMILVGQNRFYTYLDGLARPYYSPDGQIEWCGAWVTMNYYQPLPYGFPTAWIIGGGGLPRVHIDLILSSRSGYSRSYYGGGRHHRFRHR